jgi:hypothetical protein
MRGLAGVAAAGVVAVGAAAEGAAAEAGLRFAVVEEVHDPAEVVVDIAAAVGARAVEVLLDVRRRCRDRAAVVAAAGLRSTFRAAVVRVWDDSRRRAVVRAAGRLRDPAVAAHAQAADKLHGQVAAARVLVAAASQVVVRRRATLITS